MAWFNRRVTGIGSAVHVAAALAASALAIHDYTSSDSGIGGTPGALLVCGSSIALAVAGLALPRLRGGFPRLHGVLVALSVAGIAGTALAAVFLMSPGLQLLMAACLFGLLLYLLPRQPAARPTQSET